MRTGIVAFILGNICFLYFLPLDWSELNSESSVIEFYESEQPLLIVFVFFLLTLTLYKAKLVFVSSSTGFLEKLYKQLIIVVVMFFCGYFFTAIYVNQFYPALNLDGIEGRNIRVKGYIDSIPHRTDKRQSFVFVIIARERLDSAANSYWDNTFQGRVKLSWYHSEEIITHGQQWQLIIRLKKPNGLLNGGFDYEKWLYQQRIAATGYVRQGVKSEAVPSIPLLGVSHWRQNIADKLDKSLLNYPYKGLIKALTIGVRHDIDVSQWQQFLMTGTNHLIAISGLHISLISGFVWLLVNFLWRSSAALNLYYPAHYAASFFALIIAVIYAALAGFSLPTQRALIMLAVVFIAIVLRREILSSYILLLALWLVIIFDPLSALSPGFWLSFIAVAIIFFSLSSRLSSGSTKAGNIVQLGWLQLTIFIGLSAPLMILFQQVSLIAPLANFIAVPLMSFIIVPLTFLAMLLLFIYEPFGIMTFHLLKWPINGLFWLLDELSHWPLTMFYGSQPTLIIGLLLICGSIWLLMPRGWPGRWLGVLLFVPALTIETEKIAQGHIQMSVLDVGQGLAILLRTQNHNLLYDTGDNFSESFNMADVVLTPYMRSHGINTLDKVIISHSDRDHAGSFQQLVENIKVIDVLAGEPELLVKQVAEQAGVASAFQHTIKQCQQGQQWQWDNVLFRILAPKDYSMQVKNNNRSCVLHITTATQQTILLSGDIEKHIEKQLIKDYPELRADVLQVPHHGSKTSSSIVFLEQLQPKYALFSFGYKNRFHHPAQKVVQSYKKMQIKLFNTNNGVITVNTDTDDNSFSIIEYRADKKMFWHREVNHLD